MIIDTDVLVWHLRGNETAIETWELGQLKHLWLDVTKIVTASWELSHGCSLSNHDYLLYSNTNFIAISLYMNTNIIPPRPQGRLPGRESISF